MPCSFYPSVPPYLSGLHSVVFFVIVTLIGYFFFYLDFILTSFIHRFLVRDDLRRRLTKMWTKPYEYVHRNLLFPGRLVRHFSTMIHNFKLEYLRAL
ncbi:hypothetical protein OE88DRAFT_1082353 [Heliocybe sulcata]|uniref:Uncharacterized protein n=1 Tax=Heliocybe sulcata TaxID=5364 RepID=A0A5C3MWI1_9AGAM|nr:hypothetical protein OE88DRAFT_1082353 [Heliocybe sulcata]